MVRRIKKKIEEMEETGDIDLFTPDLFTPEPATEKTDDVEIIPLRDFEPGIHQNEIHIDNIKKGVPVTIPRKFLRNMVTEKVIEEIPN